MFLPHPKVKSKQMAVYRIRFKRYDQDNVYFVDIDDPECLSSDPENFSDVLEYSKETQGIETIDDIRSYCSGGDHIEPHFSSLSAAMECETTLDPYNIDFDPNIWSYDVFKIYEEED